MRGARRIDERRRTYGARRSEVVERNEAGEPFFNRCGSIPRSLLRRDSGVGWVESFGGAQDRLRDTHHLRTVGIGALRLHPPYNFARSAFSSIPRCLRRSSSTAGWFFSSTDSHGRATAAATLIVLPSPAIGVDSPMPRNDQITRQ